MPAALPLLLSKYFILAQMTVCPLQDFVPDVEVYFKPSKPVYIAEAPSRDLTRALAGNPDAAHVKDKNSMWRAVGITEAPVGGGDYSVNYAGRVDAYGNTCLYPSKVTFNLVYKPNVYIAKEVTGLPCMLRVTKLHEQRHVAADHRVIKQYIPKIKMEILWYLRSLGPQGPYPQGQVPQETKRIVKEVVDAVKPMIERLVETRRERQNDIDTLENYRYESSFCPGERPEIH